MISATSTLYVTGNCNAEGECESVNGGLVFLFMLSYYWTAQVISNVVHVTTAGTVGTWWFVPTEASGCCSKAVRESYVRSLTSSFGSICFGSLIVALIQATREMVRSIRDSDDSLLACIADCILGCLGKFSESGGVCWWCGMHCVITFFWLTLVLVIQIRESGRILQQMVSFILGSSMRILSTAVPDTLFQ